MQNTLRSEVGGRRSVTGQLQGSCEWNAWPVRSHWERGRPRPPCERPPCVSDARAGVKRLRGNTFEQPRGIAGGDARAPDSHTPFSSETHDLRVSPVTDRLPEDVAATRGWKTF